MRVQPENRPLSERFDHLLNVLPGKKFLEKHRQGNEIPFYICPFNPEETGLMENVRRNLVKQLQRQDISILEIDLYDLSIDIMKERGVWERVIEEEVELPKDKFFELLQGILDPENHIVPAIEKIMNNAPSFHIVFLTGVGEVFPFIRSHNVLSNLQRIIREIPVVLFFPGQYTHTTGSGSSLSLFGKFNGDRYYRAYNIYHCQIGV